jgi:hypothetical protein
MRINDIETSLQKVINHKTDIYIDTLIQHCEDDIVGEVSGVMAVEPGILPPLFKEHKDEIKKILLNYFLENTRMKEEK